MWKHDQGDFWGERYNWCPQGHGRGWHLTSIMVTTNAKWVRYQANCSLCHDIWKKEGFFVDYKEFENCIKLCRSFMKEGTKGWEVRGIKVPWLPHHDAASITFVPSYFDARRSPNVSYKPKSCV
jgi:hypothetical protein